MWGSRLLTSACFGAQQSSIYSAAYNKDGVAQTAVLHSSDLGLNFKYLSNKKGTNWIVFLVDNVLFPPLFPLCELRPASLRVGSMWLLKYWHPRAIAFFLLLPGSIKKPVFPLALLCSSSPSCSSWEGKVNASDEVIPGRWHLLLQIISVKTNSLCFLRFCASRITNWVTFWSLWALRVCSYLIFVPTAAIVFVCVEACILGSIPLGDKEAGFKTWNVQVCAWWICMRWYHRVLILGNVPAAELGHLHSGLTYGP